jgi:cytidine deaminase
VNDADNAQRERLLAAARDVLARAYAPYSHFRVGAALLTDSGQVHRGCNVENLSYGLSCCAERSAIAVAVAAEGPGVRLRAVAVATDPDVPCSPCGACRQVISEFGPEAVVLYRGPVGPTARVISELLPDAFSSLE